jgi:hypothetical protein
VREKKAARVAVAKEKLGRIQAEYEEAQRALTESEKAEKESRAAQRRAAAQQRRLAGEAAAREQRKKAHLAEQHAEQTRAAKRASAQRKHEQAQEAARRKREAQKEGTDMTAVSKHSGNGRRKNLRYGPDLAPINERRRIRLQSEAAKRRATREVTLADRAFRKQQATRPAEAKTPSSRPKPGGTS